MDCCEFKNVGCINYENVCLNCSVIHGYQYVHESIYRDYSINI